MTFGQNLRAARKAKGLTLKQVASALETSVQRVCDVEHGRRAPFGEEYTEELAKVLRVKVANINAWLDSERCPHCGTSTFQAQSWSRLT